MSINQQSNMMRIRLMIWSVFFLSLCLYLLSLSACSFLPHIFHFLFRFMFFFCLGFPLPLLSHATGDRALTRVKKDGHIEFGFSDLFPLFFAVSPFVFIIPRYEHALPAAPLVFPFLIFFIALSFLGCIFLFSF